MLAVFKQVIWECNLEVMTSLADSEATSASLLVPLPLGTGGVHPTQMTPAFVFGADLSMLEDAACE